jgi:hypothetical protein
MSIQAYVLLDVVEGRKQQVAQYLLGRRGILAADIVELTMGALTAIESMIEDLNILPVQSMSNNPIPF